MRHLSRGLEGPAGLALRPFVLRRLPGRVAVAIRSRGGNEEEVPHLQGQDPPVEGNGLDVAYIPLLERAEAEVGADWDGMTFLEDNNDKHTGRTLLMPEYVHKAFRGGDVKTALRWITANQTEDRVNSVFGMFSCLATALMLKSLTLMTLLLQLGADVDRRDFQGQTLICSMFCPEMLSECGVIERARLLLSWGASFPREVCVSTARMYGRHELANLLESELGGRRCEIVNLSARPELNGKTCVADEYLPDSNRYRVTLETKSKAILVIGPGKLKRRDRTPQDCGYYIEFKNGRTIRHDFDSSEECQAFVAAMNRDETQPAVTEEAEARAERAAAELLAELLAELGLDDSPHEAPTGEDQAKKSKKKKKKGGKKKRK
ncbi:hypothetical protein THAOC_08388 [Thalassiosira oceanica]|uniref:Uncharacterized protein n=1 Tax=Thalassiosira oceanica TaxID=159749 RepID=K0TA59_THAOC|nr:hypothetical protein THAOC_08388 [Thalassiosira oceanica]|eukprot:EJK70266.1 hypothetical protein THAOC_08388 [Thalassiosira oceanica]